MLNEPISKYYLNLQFSMKTMLRLYAKTSKGNDKYLYNELISMGLKPQYEDLLHSFYFNATFNDLFKLSFESFTVQNLYIQLGHRFPLSTTRSSSIHDNQSLVSEYLRKINFRNYLPMQRGLVENITLKLLVRQSSSNLPSENAIISIFQNYLQKEVIMKQYRSMFKGQHQNRMENYYDIKHIVEKKWDHQDLKQQEQLKLLQDSNKTKNLKLIGSTRQESHKNLTLSQRHLNQDDSELQLHVPYSPHFILYIRRNHARLLLKLNKQSMHKFGWKRNVGWGPIRQTLTASILYRSGIVDQFKSTNNITFWDPFCGSGTIPLVLYSMLKSLHVRKDIQSNFIWQHWSIYNERYLKEYIDKTEENLRKLDVKIFGSDIDIKATRNTVDNFKQLVSVNEKAIKTHQQTSTNFLKCNPSDQIFQILPNTVYIGCGDFQQMAPKIFIDKNQKINIATNLPYLGERSKQHHPINQLHSIYKRFNLMISKYREYIQNIFVIVDSDVNNRDHFIKTSKEEWRILQMFNNGGIQVCLLGWAENKIGWKNLEVYSSNNQNRAVTEYDATKTQHLTQYRKQIKDIENKRYELPAYLDKSKQYRSVRRVRQKRKARHLRAAYLIFAKQRDKKQVFERYARKNLALRLSQRGKTWKQRNLSMMDGNLEGKQGIIKKQFETRIEEALKRSEQIKDRKKGVSQKVRRKW